MQHTRLALLTMGILLLFTGIAHASGDSHALPWGNFFFRIVNLVLFAGIIWYFFGAKIKAFFVGRSKGIADELAALEAGKAKAQEKLAAIESRISSLDEERKAILDAYRKQGETLEAEIIDRANKTAGQIIEQAKATAQSEIDNAIEDLRSQLADEIIAAAEKSLAKKLTPAEQAKLVDKYLTRVVLN